MQAAHPCTVSVSYDAPWPQPGLVDDLSSLVAVAGS